MVCKISVKIFGKRVAAIISPDGADVEEVVSLYLQHSFTVQRSTFNFLAPTANY